MKIYKIQEPGKLSSQAVKPASLLDDEVLVKVSHIGICGSDTQLFQGTYKGPFSYPIAFGHEWSGVVEKTGNHVKSFQSKDKVTGDCSRFCGACAYCEQDKNLCKEIEKYGITVDGASADYIIRKQKYLYKAPDAIDLPVLCLSEPIAVSSHLIRKIERCAGSLEGKKALVFGAGAIGLGAMLLLIHQFKCSQVDVFDISVFRHELARSLGAGVLSEDALNHKVKDSGYRALYDAQYDLVIEATGSAEVFTRSLNLVKPLGVIGSLGMIPEVCFQHKTVVVKALTIIGSIGGTGEFPFIIDFIQRNHELIKKMITHEYRIDQADQAFQMSRKTDKALKVLLKMG